MTLRCGHCAGNLLSEYDYELRRDVTKCLQCGREENGVIHQMASAVVSTGTTVGSPDDSELTAYMAAARRLVSARDAVRRARLNLDKARDEERAATVAHEAARVKFNLFLAGGTAGKGQHMCRDCGATMVAKRGRCPECAREAQRGYQRRHDEKKRAAVEVAA